MVQFRAADHRPTTDVVKGDLMRIRCVVAFMLLGLTAERSCAGFTVFDNGSFSGSQIGRFNWNHDHVRGLHSNCNPYD